MYMRAIKVFRVNQGFERAEGKVHAFLKGPYTYKGKYEEEDRIISACKEVEFDTLWETKEHGWIEPRQGWIVEDCELCNRAWLMGELAG